MHVVRIHHEELHFIPMSPFDKLINTMLFGGLLLLILDHLNEVVCTYMYLKALL